jgi:hypothetical protein
MQEHPVPQNVTGYEFHLIGQMTLKQFLEVAGGILGAVIINMTNLPGFIKIPLMIISALLGAALAFIPLEGRPLDRWFFAFVKSIYQPTMFFWKKTNSVPDAFTYTQPTNVDATPSVDYTPIRLSRVQEFIKTTAIKVDTVEDAESQAATDVLKLFSDSTLPKLSTAPIIPDASATAPLPVSGRIIELNLEKPAEAPAPLTPPTAQENKPAAVIVERTEPIRYADPQGVVPELLPTAPSAQSTITPGKLETVYSAAPDMNTTSGLAPVPKLTDFPFPNKPTTANVVAGMVLSKENKIVENAIVTILRESDHTPMRAMKTNTLGQFAVVTPLEGGTYRISVEKDGYNFDNYSLVLNNQIVEPILLKAK